MKKQMWEESEKRREEKRREEKRRGEERRGEERREEERRGREEKKADQRRERVRRKKMQAHKKVEKSRFTVFFPMICGSGRSKSRLAKAAGEEPSGEMRD